MTFEDLGLRSELAENAGSAGYENPTPLQAAAVPVLRRGGNVVLRASAGAGVVGTYALGLLDRILEAGFDADDDALRPAALVLAPDTASAAAIAASAGRFAHGLPVRVAAMVPGWRAEGAALLVVTPRQAMEAVAASRLKLDALLALVLDGAEALHQVNAEALESFTATVPKEAQRVVVGDPQGDVADFITRHARKAMTFPPVHADRREAPGLRADFAGPVQYAVVPASAMTAATASILDAAAAPASVLCRSAARAERVGRELASRGHGHVTTAGPDEVPDDGFVVSYGPPFDAASFAQRHAAGGAVITTSRELPHLRRIAAEAGATLEPAALPAPAHDDLDAFRDRIRDAACNGDIEPQLLVLEPLLAEFSMAELAAAATLLARRQAPAATEPKTPAQGPPPGHTFTRLFISAGDRDGVRAGDVLGAITGETGIAADLVGKIEINDTFSTVEVDQSVARQVIDALNGTTLRSRSLRVDYDRKGAARARPAQGRRPPSRRPPGRG